MPRCQSEWPFEGFLPPRLEQRNWNISKTMSKNSIPSYSTLVGAVKSSWLWCCWWAAPSTWPAPACLLPLLLLLLCLVTNLCGGLVKSGTETIWIKNVSFPKKDYFCCLLLLLSHRWCSPKNSSTITNDGTKNYFAFVGQIFGWQFHLASPPEQLHSEQCTISAPFQGKADIVQHLEIIQIFENSS